MLTNIKTNFSQALLLQSFLVILLERNVIKFLVLDTQEIIVFRNVVFHETVFSFLQNSVSPKSPNISTYLLLYMMLLILLLIIQTFFTGMIMLVFLLICHKIILLLLFQSFFPTQLHANHVEFTNLLLTYKIMFATIP